MITTCVAELDNRGVTRR